VQEPVLPNTVPFCVSEVLEALRYILMNAWEGLERNGHRHEVEREGWRRGEGVADSLSFKRGFL
jgi:hypothetical protein